MSDESAGDVVFAEPEVHEVVLRWSKSSVRSPFVFEGCSTKSSFSHLFLILMVSEALIALQRQKFAEIELAQGQSRVIVPGSGSRH